MLVPSPTEGREGTRITACTERVGLFHPRVGSERVGVSAHENTPRTVPIRKGDGDLVPGAGERDPQTAAQVRS